MTVTANALEMTLQLRRLQQRHNIPSDIYVAPQAAAVPHPMVLEGYASTCDIDLTRTKFRPYAFGYPLLFCQPMPRLLYRHDESQPAGRIDSLQYDHKGNLLIRATVTHEPAKRCNAFSIGARVHAYTMHDVDSPSFYALVTSAELTKISLTDQPANMAALVTRRYRASPTVQLYSLLGEKVSRLAKLTNIIRQDVRP